MKHSRNHHKPKQAHSNRHLVRLGILAALTLLSAVILHIDVKHLGAEAGVYVLGDTLLRSLFGLES